MTAAETHGGGWVQLVFHHVCDQCDAYSITPAHLDEFLTWLDGQAGNGVSVQTTQQVIGGAAKPPVSP